ncbi:class I SAM-dependent methyltransferase [Deinococcus irradiatisoli]|uniref:Class I SAM-dependent methyltransferase n=1 Tax=Deinococcus irradiatisoli TaxID=2202254 RepID=A0A2Z3JG65_9DEIO|nr:class I SAM-dependent methyltransferase [Deinococcus irradiatisoli]AWN24173.1 class I SAM-dependent methyltransferase [Deinococcus irradiatisoli]
MNYDDFADLYDHQYDLYRDDLHFYAQLSERVGGAVLEVGAGTGRVTAYLTRRGVKVTGLEPSARMLERARERAGRERLALKLVQGDVRTFQLEERFDLIIAPFNALMHLYTPNEQLQALENIHRHLVPGGQLAFDLSVPRYGERGTLRHEGETFYKGAERTDVFLVQRLDEVKQRVTTDYYVDTVGEDQVLRRRFFSLEQRYFTRYEVEWLLRCAGFESPRVQGGFQGGPLDTASETMVFLTRRK